MGLILKRAFDSISSLAAVVILSPLFIGIAIAVKLSSRGPVFFSQERVGRGGRLFRLIKFRTMVVNAHELGPLLTHGDDPRITGVGRRLRRMKLDELPQLFNVIKGDMSVVGPRPEVPKYVALYTDEQRRILELRPGLTGLDALAYRDEEKLLAGVDDIESFYVNKLLPAKLHLGCEYVDKRGFWFDLKLVFRTLWRIVRPLEDKQAAKPEKTDA